MLLAYTRAVSPTLGACELTHLERTPIDVSRAVAEHAAYERTLRRRGVTVRRLAPAPHLLARAIRDALSPSKQQVAPDRTLADMTPEERAALEARVGAKVKNHGQ